VHIGTLLTVIFGSIRDSDKLDRVFYRRCDGVHHRGGGHSSFFLKLLNCLRHVPYVLYRFGLALVIYLVVLK
jgi:hypothetical protein